MNVFISYATEDREIATKIAKILDDLGIDRFLDVKDINWGDNVLTTIHGGIRKSSHLLLIVSPASAKSQWVAYETGHAASQKKLVLPYLTHPSMDVPGFLRHLHYETNVEDLRSFFEREKGIGVEVQEHLDRMIRNGEWRLVFNPPDRSKPIGFGDEGRITAGQNKNEHWWRIVAGKLEIVQADGRVHSRFFYDEPQDKFVHTNEPDTSGIQNQIIERAT